MSESFTNQNLRGKSFRGQKLTDKDFSYADLRGADFTSAVLTNADFSNARAGQRPRWIFGLIVFSLILALISGYIVAYAGAVIGSLMVDTRAKAVGFWTGMIALALLVILGFVIIRKGLGSALGIFAITVGLSVVILAARGNVDTAVNSILQEVALAGIVSGVFLSAIAASVAWRLSKYALFAVVVLSLTSFVPGALEGIKDLEVAQEYMTTAALIVSGTVACISIGLSTFIGWRVTQGDRNYFLIPAITTWLASVGGTCFRGANLTDASFTKAQLKGVDFREAILRRTNWHQVSYLEQCRLEGTYLENPQVRQLAVTKTASEQNFNYMNLRGLNLEGADLKGASLVGTDFNQSNLKSACLAGAKLAKAQLYQTDLTGACLTGAYIQDWGISTETSLNDIKCDYIYMRLPNNDDADPCRKPDNKQEKFQPGDFADFIAPIIKTLDLYQTQNVDTRKIADRFKTLDLFHHEGIDAKVAAVTIQKLAEKYPEAALQVIALEGRGNEKIRLQAKVSDTIDRSELSKEYAEQYRRVQSLSDSDIQRLLLGFEEKDSRIRSLEKILENALRQPRFYVETYQHEGEFVMTKESKQITINSEGQGNIINIADYMRDVTNTVHQSINQSAASDEIKDLVKKLTEQVTAITAQVDTKVAEQMGGDLEVLGKEMTKSEPRKRWYELSLDGLKEAAVAVGELGTPILETLSKLSPLILATLSR